MKKNYITIMGFLLTLHYATASVPLMDNPPEYDSKERKAPAHTIRVNFDNNIISIWSPFVVNMVDVIVKNNLGEVIYSETIEELSSTYIIQLSEEEAQGVYCIELIYGGQHLYKYID